MRLRHIFGFTAKLLTALLATIFLVSVAAAQASYTVIDLGTLKGGSARVHGINSSGQVVGQSGDPHGSQTRAFFWMLQGGMRDLGTLPGGDYSAAYAINDSGQVVGSSNLSDTVHAFSWTRSGGLKDLGTLPDANSSRAFGINSSGLIVGESGTHAVLWQGGAVLQLGDLGGSTSEAHAINNAGQVVGVSDTPQGPHAFLWSNSDGMKDLGTLPGDRTSRANYINNSGAVVGASVGSGGVRAFLWNHGAMQDLGMLAGGTYAEATAVNNLGQVVGLSGSSLGTRAFLWSSASGMVDMNTLVTGVPNIVLTGAFAINDSGQIVAYGILKPGLGPHETANLDHIHAGPTRVFLLKPH